MAFINKYPYTDQHELNLDWVISKIMQLTHDMDDFKVVNQISFNGTWDITKQYPAWAFVDNGGDGYLSIKPVPAGVELTNEIYWRLVANYSAIYADFQDRIITLEKKCTGIITPQMYGAVGDGITDDTTAFINALNDIPEGYRLSVPAGTYVIRQPIIIDKQIAIVGCTSQDDTQNDIPLTGSILKYTGSESAFVTIKNDGVILKNVSIVGNDASKASTTGVLITGDFGNVIWNIKLVNVLVKSFNNGISASGLLVSSFDNVIVNNCSFGFYFDNHNEINTSITFKTCWALRCSYGYYLHNVTYSTLISCACDGVNYGYEMVDSVCVTLVSCGCEAAEYTAYVFGNTATNATMINCFSDRCGSSGDCSMIRTYGANVTIIGCKSNSSISDKSAIVFSPAKFLNCIFDKEISFDGVAGAARDSFVTQSPIS